DVDSGRVRLVQAGHPHPLLLRADGRTEFLGIGGFPVGLFANARYERLEARLFPGDRLLFYSDGFTECRLRDGSMLGEEGLVQLVAKVQPSASGREFLDDLYWHLGNAACPDEGAEDDVSAALLEFGV
ncbi:MAG: PP2C family protein-serine/threonine phosphatase, partial [Paracoccaceae bacterium]